VVPKTGGGRDLRDLRGDLRGIDAFFQRVYISFSYSQEWKYVRSPTKELRRKRVEGGET
jgi:hypothetical protein